MTSMLPFLSDDELREIACPLSQPAAIGRWFRRQGFEVKTKPNGMPLISRRNFESVMGERIHVSGPDEPIKVEPDVAAFLSRFGKEAQYAHGSKAKK